MMGWNPQCYIPGFVEIGLPVQQKRFLKRFYHIWSWWPFWTCDQHHVIRFLIFLYMKAFIQNLVQIGTVVSEKIQFEFLYVHDLGSRSRDDLDLQFSQIFINIIRCLLPLLFRALAAIVSENSTIFTFSYRKA